MRNSQWGGREDVAVSRNPSHPIWCHLKISASGGCVNCNTHAHTHTYTVTRKTSESVGVYVFTYVHACICLYECLFAVQTAFYDRKWYANTLHRKVLHYRSQVRLINCSVNLGTLMHTHSHAYDTHTHTQTCTYHTTHIHHVLLASHKHRNDNSPLHYAIYVSKWPTYRSRD